MFGITTHYPKSGIFCLLGHAFRIAMIPLVHALGCCLGLCLALLNPILKYFLLVLLKLVNMGILTHGKPSNREHESAH